VYEKLLEYETALEYYKAYLEIKDSLDVAKRLSQEELAQQQLYLQRTEKQIQEVVDKGEIKDYQLQQLKLESENKDIQLKNQQLDAKQKLQAARLRESELEKERAEQELRTAEAEKKNQDLILKQQQLEKDKVEKQNLLLEKEAEVKDLELKRRESVNRNLIIIVSLTVLVMILALFAVSRIRKSNKVIKIEKSKSDNLLLNILPKSTAEELKTMGQSLPRRYESVTVLFTDFKGFTQITETMPPEKLVDSLGLFFEGFDNIMKKHGLEKIKTIGDAYMCAGGIPEPIPDAAIRTVKAANEMLALTEEINAQKRKAGMGTWGIRIGVHTGPVVAGVIGNHKFQYDIWGDTVNLAARMESSGEPGKINISETTYTEIKDEIPCTYRGEIAAKNKGNVKMYFVD
jgi:class 3 adenylate cyclase